jgi:hypothetical protein
MPQTISVNQQAKNRLRAAAAIPHATTTRTETDEDVTINNKASKKAAQHGSRYNDDALQQSLRVSLSDNNPFGKVMELHARNNVRDYWRVRDCGVVVAGLSGMY